MKKNSKTSKKQLSTSIEKKTLTDSSQINTLMWLFLGLTFLHFIMISLSTHAKHDEYNWITRTWGFDNISFYPPYVVFFVYAIVVAVCIPYINRLLVVFFSFEAWTILFNKIKKFKYVTFILLSILSGFIFYYFHIKYHFLGDMDIRIKQTIDKQYIYSEYLTMYLIQVLYTFLNGKFAITGYQTFVLQSVIAGVIYLFFAFLIADLTGKSLLEKFVTFISFISIGALLLFFGYVEIYAIPATSVVIYIYCALLWAKNKIGFILPFLALILAIAFHLMAIGLAPSFVIVMFQKKGKHIPFLNKIKTAPFIIVVLLLLPIVVKLARVFHFGDIMPVTKNDQYPQLMLMVSSKHIWEFLNSQFLAGGVGFFILIYITVKGIRRKLKFDSVMWLYASASFFMLFIAFVTNKMRGSGDWDICAFPALIYSPFVVYSLFRNEETTGLYAGFTYTLLIIIVLNFANTLPWIGINSGDRSIKKIATMLENDPGYYYIKKLPGISNLALSYKANGLSEESLKYFEKVYRKYYNDPRSHLNYASQLMESGKEKEAEKILINLIHQAPYVSTAYPLLFSIYQKNNQNDKIYGTIDFLFNNYITGPAAYLSYFDKKDLLNYFNYLYQVEVQKGKSDKAKRIAGVLNTLQGK